MTAVSALQSIGDALGMGHDFAEIVPYQLVELVGGSVPGGTLLLQAGLGLLVLAGADVVPLLLVFVVLGDLRARDRAKLTPSAAHQRPQQVVVGLIVALGEGFVLGELLACEVELLLVDHRRHGGNRNPLISGGSGTAVS